MWSVLSSQLECVQLQYVACSLIPKSYTRQGGCDAAENCFFALLALPRHTAASWHSKSSRQTGWSYSPPHRDSSSVHTTDEGTR